MHLSLLVERFVPTKVIRVCNKDKPWFNDDRRHAFDLKQEAHLLWSRDCSQVNFDEFVYYLMGLMKFMTRLCVCLVSVAGMF